MHPRILIISILKGLQDSGDQVTRIEGVLSGTLSLIFNKFSPASGIGIGGSFSTASRNAKDLGYTESDSRDDLIGMDVAGKITTIGRFCGLQIESAASVKVRSLIPGTLRDITDGNEFLSRFAEFDEEWEKTRHLEEQEGKVLRW